MNATLKSLLVIVVLAIAIYFMLDHWQENVTIYASTCETDSGMALPASVCKAIVNYRYQKDN